MPPPGTNFRQALPAHVPIARYLSEFQATVQLTGRWAGLVRSLDPQRFEAALRRYAGQATYHNALDFHSVVRRWIRERRYAPNSPLTVALKGSSTPLVDTRDLLGNIRLYRVNWGEYFVGVHSSAGRTNNKQHPQLRQVEIANIIHEGFIIRLTPKVMAAIMSKLENVDPGLRRQYWRFRYVKGGSGLLNQTVRVPPRPFIKNPFEDQGFQARARQRWERAMYDTLRSLHFAVGSGSGGSAISIGWQSYVP